MKTYAKDDLGSYDLADLEKVAVWHKKKYRDQPNLTYMFYSEGNCVYTFIGTAKELKTIDRFLTIYRKFKKLFGIKG